MIVTEHTAPHARPAANDTPATCANRLTRALGPSRALLAAERLKADQPEYSPAAAFYDEACRCIERGIVEARNLAQRVTGGRQ